MKHGLLVFCLFGLIGQSIAIAVDRPNILWITVEDMSPDLGCYGDAYSVSPNIDKLAAQGIRYTRAWSNAGMCSPARATLITGMYPPSTGAQNMRSVVTLPDNIRGYPEYLRRAGYFCTNHSKTDYNWQQPDSTWDIIDSDWKANGWDKRSGGQPFFTIINITDTHSSQLYYRDEENWKRRHAALSPDERHDPDKVTVPPYYPDTPEVRGDLARYYDNITFSDRIVGEILSKLEQDGLEDETIVFFYSDHGRGMPRSKGWCFQTSLRVPFIIRFPEKFRHLAPGDPGTVDDRMVSFVDFAPTLLSLAGVDIPVHMQGKPFLGSRQVEPREYCFAYRDRMDERIDLIRAVWDGRYKYIRNYMPHLPWFHHQTRDYPSRQPTYRIWHQMAASGTLSPEQSVYMAWSKPREQLFDTLEDPYELDNLADSVAHKATLARLRNVLHAWQDDILDLGFIPESMWWTRFDVPGDKLPRHSFVRENPGIYDLARARQVADWVGQGGLFLPRQIEALADDDPVVRYWAAVGILACEDDIGQATAALESLLDDPDYSVRVVAAQILVELDKSEAALQVLMDSLDDRDPFVVLPAANALDHLGVRARPAVPAIRQFLDREPDPARFESKLPVWLLSGTLENLQN